MEKISRLAAGTIRVEWDVIDEKIERMEIHGDFFAGEDLDNLCKSLIGCRYNKDDVYGVLSNRNCDNIIYGISKEELLEAMF